MKHLSILSAVVLLISFPLFSQELTRGIGIYPGLPSESFEPSFTSDQTYRNLAGNRMVTTSSDYDYNLTGQLLTDGITFDGTPALLEVSTPDGKLSRKVKESTIDGGQFSNNALMGAETRIRYRWQGYSVSIDSIAVSCRAVYEKDWADGGFDIFCTDTAGRRIGGISGNGLPGKESRGKMPADPDKETDTEMLPVRNIDVGFPAGGGEWTSGVDLNLKMKGAHHWIVYEVEFYRNGHRVVNALPSYEFTSVWMSGGKEHEWAMVDLGAEAEIEEVDLLWLNKATRGSIEFSQDGNNWKMITGLPGGTSLSDNIKCSGSGRYVRVSMENPLDPEREFSMTEMKVFGRGGLKVVPHPQGKANQNKMSLDGGGWKLQRASEVAGGGAEISSAGYPDGEWLTATVPGTVLTSYVNAGAVADPNYDDNVNRISESFFNGDFWYRREFDAPDEYRGKNVFLCFDGINWEAEIWLNGTHIQDIDGAFMRGRSDIGKLLKDRGNVLAVKIISNEYFGAVKEKTVFRTGFNGGILGYDNPTFHASIGWDWITTVRGRNSGIWNDVYLISEGKVNLSDPLVSSTLSGEGLLASMTPSVMVRNNEDKPVTGVLEGWIGDIKFSRTLTLAAREIREECFSPEDFNQLKDRKMNLWWPNGYGDPYLYDSGFSFSTSDHKDSISFKAGIREMKWKDENSCLKLYVNGRRFIPLGGNWGFSESNLNYRGREYEVAVNYHKQMNFNMIRNWVGQTGDEEFYDSCDRNGIMIWQDFWLANPVDGPDPKDEGLFLDNAKDWILRIRNHPSIALYCGRNEGYPPKGIDSGLRDMIAALHPDMLYFPSSADDGVSGHGPYCAMDEEYYFTHQTGKLHSERGMPNVMNIESLRRMLAPEHLWPQGDMWGKHDYTLGGAQKATTFNDIVAGMFGNCTAEEFSTRAQLVNYNGYRAMYESGARDRLGLLIWMSHSCWPSLTWTTYDYYFDPDAAFFGSKKACEPLHIQYNPSSNAVEVVNYCGGKRPGLKASGGIYDLKGKQLSRFEAFVDSPEDSTIPCFTLQKPSVVKDAILVKLVLEENGNPVSDNFYILSASEVSVPWLGNLENAGIKTTAQFDGNTASVTVRNNSDIPAIMLRVNLKASDNQQILPVEYSDNYFSLLPGESRKIDVRWDKRDARRLNPKIEVSGINVK